MDSIRLRTQACYHCWDSAFSEKSTNWVSYEGTRLYVLPLVLSVESMEGWTRARFNKVKMTDVR